jgi:hypothetical protein
MLQRIVWTLPQRGQQRQYRGDKARYAASILVRSKSLDQMCGPNQSNL